MHAFQERMTAIEVEHFVPSKWRINNSDSRIDKLWLLQAKHSHNDDLTLSAILTTLKYWKLGWEDKEKTKRVTPTTEDDASNECEK